MRFRVFVVSGDAFPQGYGMAWRCWHRDGAVAMPIPFNRIAGFLRDWWNDMTIPRHLRDEVYENGEHYRAFLHGIDAGRRFATRGR